MLRKFFFTSCYSNDPCNAHVRKWTFAEHTLVGVVIGAIEEGSQNELDQWGPIPWLCLAPNSVLIMTILR